MADSDPQPVPPPPQPPPLRRARAPPPPLDLSVSNARKFNWTVAWQRDNPKQEGSDSRDRYAAYCAATTLADARVLGARAADILHDYAKGYLRILPNSLSNDEAAATTPLAPDTVVCMLNHRRAGVLGRVLQPATGAQAAPGAQIRVAGVAR